MPIKFAVWCRCNSCDNVQRVSAESLAKGDNFCRMGGFRNRCNGKLEMFAESQDASETNAIAILGYIASISGNTECSKIAQDAFEDAATWREGGETPQQMGWVDQNGRP